MAAHRKFRVTNHALSGDFSVLGEKQRKRIEKVLTKDTRWLGFKLLFRSSGGWLVHPRFAPSLWLDRFEDYRRWLAARPAVRVIHIVRSTPIEWLKSKYLSDRARAWAGKQYPHSLLIEIPIPEAVRRLKCKDWIDQGLSQLSQTNPYLRVSYEEFLESDDAVVGRLVRFLGCDPAMLRQIDYRRHTKQSTRPASDYISNYAQLVAALRKRTLLPE